MKTYKDFRPTSYDSHINLFDKENWLVVPFGRNRDSGCVTESNFHIGLHMLGGVGADVEVHRFGHWACGWFEVVLVRPDTLAEEKAEAIERKLADYPILCEDDLSEREWEAAHQLWAHCYNVRERINYIREHRGQFEFRSFADMLGCVRGKHFAGNASELVGG